MAGGVGRVVSVVALVALGKHEMILLLMLLIFFPL